MKSFIASLICLALSPAFAATVPDELEFTTYASSEIVPSPACLCASPDGVLFVGVDMNGSLGKDPGKGKIIRLVDTDHDGVADSHTVFAHIDNPRGMISLGDKLFVLHTVIPEDTGVLTGMHLSLLEDADGDGVADGEPKRLVSDISTLKHNQDRGADHTTNGITLGIDGWIYIAVGDFGMVGTKGSDGTELTMLGGGIVRVRPDGTELEVYTHGMRNIYDVAIDPFLNIFTRGNTNDGGGWNVRFTHHIQTGEYGYPVLFKNFTGEILPALEDIGGGSGAGAIFFGEPNWPDQYSNVPMMADWGRNELAIHRLTPDGASFTQEPETFIKCSQIADVDVDGSGRLYLAAWDGASYKGSDSIGYVERVVPKGWEYVPFPNLGELSDEALLDLLNSESAVARLQASQELLKRQVDAALLLALAGNAEATLETRVAALFTAKQLGATNAAIATLSEDEAILEWVIRVLTDRKTQLEGVELDFLTAALENENPRVQIAAAVALGRLGDASAASTLLALGNPPEGTYQPEPETAQQSETPTYRSNQLKPMRSARVNISVEGWKELHLAVGEGGDGKGHDHVAWFDPTLIMKDGSKVKLTDLEWKSATQGWGETAIGADCAGNPLVRADGKPFSFGIGTHSPSHIVYDLPEGALKFQATGNATIGAVDGRGHVVFAAHSSKPAFKKVIEGPHATPNSAIILPHIAINALRALNAEADSLAALDGENRDAALWVMKAMHSPVVVDGLIEQFKAEEDPAKQEELLALLARLYQKEAPYDGSWWWSTRPDTRGPYYVPEKWEKSDDIAAVLIAAHETGTPEIQQALEFWNTKLRLEIEAIPEAVLEDKSEDEGPKVDISKITGKSGEIGNTSIEDVMLALDTIKGDIDRGEELFTQQGCMACHTISPDQAPKGPYMGQVGAILTREQIAESILKPAASISQGFVTFMITKNDGTAMTGFKTSDTPKEIEMRDIVGNVHIIKREDIKDEQELEISMMPPGLANALSLEDFIALVDFLASKKG